MAQRRMFSKRIINSGRFIKLPHSSQLLYFQLGINADDDGVVEAFTVMNSVGASEEDLAVLVDKGFVIILNDDLVTYITDWNENNQIRKDRKEDSIYTDLLEQVLSDNQGATLRTKACGKLSSTERKSAADFTPLKRKSAADFHSDDEDLSAQDRIGKDSIDKDSIDKDSITPPPKSKSFSEKIDAASETDTGGGVYTLPEGVLKTWGDCGMMIDGHTKNALSALAEEHGEDLVIDAIGVAADNGVKKISYVKSVLKRWKEAGGKVDYPNTGPDKAANRYQHILEF